MKKIFDEVFDTTKYTKALNELRQVSKKYAKYAKEFNVMVNIQFTTCCAHFICEVDELHSTINLFVLKNNALRCTVSSNVFCICILQYIIESEPTTWL